MKPWSIERVVTILTPVFGAAAATGTAWLGTHFPGLPRLNPTDVVALEVTGFTGATGAALKWLHGRHKFIAFTDEAKATLKDALAKLQANPQAGPAVADIEALLKAHSAEIETSIDQHVPKAVGQALGLLFSQLGANTAAAPAPVTANVPPAPPAAPAAPPPTVA